MGGLLRMSAWMVLLLCGVALADEPATAPADPTARTTSRPGSTQPGEKDKNGDHLVVTQHSLKLGGKTLDYTATAGTMAQKDESGKPLADMFFVAYTLDEEKATSRVAGPPAGRDHEVNQPHPTTRPITFVFNGGPGAASVWLHIGTAGPKRIKLDENGMPTPPPFELVDNESTWLDATDLVFIDPVGTGYSRPAKGIEGDQFYGVEQDIRSVGNFIRLYTTRNQRWASPKFLAGESYGTTRAAGLSQYLLDKQGISLSGIVLISAALNFQAFVPAPGNELPFALYLPSYTANAWYHKKLPADLQKDLDVTLREVQQWSLGDYSAALMKGDSLDDATRRQIAERLARYTGLSVDWILKADLRIDPGRFRKELLADEHKVIGRFDGRIVGFSSDPLNDQPEYDPSLSLFLPVYSANLNAYVRDQLKYESDLPYEVLTERVNPWNFGKGGSGYLYVADTLRDAMLQNPRLKILFGSGRMDLATPFASSDYTIDHLKLPEGLRKNIARTYFPAGHMMYHDTASRRKLHDDVTGFIRADVP